MNAVIEKTVKDFEKYSVSGIDESAIRNSHPEFFPDMRKELGYDKIIPEDKISEFEEDCFMDGTDFMYNYNHEYHFLGAYLNSAKAHYDIYKTLKRKLNYLKEMTGIKS